MYYIWQIKTRNIEQMPSEHEMISQILGDQIRLHFSAFISSDEHKKFSNNAINNVDDGSKLDPFIIQQLQGTNMADYRGGCGNAGVKIHELGGSNNLLTFRDYNVKSSR